MRTLRPLLAPWLVLGSLVLVSPALGQDTDQLFTQGTTALEAGKHEDALRAFEAVWKTRKTYDVATVLAQAELQLGKHRDAAEHLAYALRSFPVSGKPALRKQIEEMLADAKTHVAALRVQVNVDKADVFVNGKPAGAAPVADELFAEAGPIVVEARLDGYEPAKQTIEVKKGEAREVELKVARSAGSTERSLTLPVIAFGVGGAGLVMGAIAGGIAAAKFSDVKKTCGEKLVCPQSARGEVDAGNTASAVATAGFVVAGLGAAAGITLLLIPVKNKTSARVSVALSPTYVGIKGTF